MYEETDHNAGDRPVAASVGRHHRYDGDREPSVHLAARADGKNLLVLDHLVDDDDGGVRRPDGFMTLGACRE